MRCPKCGYISYDHQDSCGKCKKDISASKDMLGGVRKITPVQYLVFGAASEEALEKEIAIDEDYIDSDLEILMDDENEDSTDGIVDFQEDFSLEDDEPSAAVAVESPTEDEDFDLDFDFDLDEEEDSESTPQDNVSLDIPEELDDLSDLSPVSDDKDDLDLDFDLSFDDDDIDEPAKPAESFSLDLEEDDDDIEINLDEISLDLDGLDDAPAAPAASAVLSKEVSSLDDINFSLPIESTETKTPRQTGNSMDMDSALDFELDLDGLDLGRGEIEMKKD
ncbi:MAG: hypothetical protein OCC45_04720 [Desulfotalea sp.]